jgi:hypothetical protein
MDSILLTNSKSKLKLRFVNFITEPYQTNIYAKPIKAIATSVIIFKLLIKA